MAGIGFWHDPKTLLRYAKGFLDSEFASNSYLSGTIFLWFQFKICMRQLFQLELVVEVGYCQSLKEKESSAGASEKELELLPCSVTGIIFCKPRAEFQKFHTVQRDVTVNIGLAKKFIWIFLKVCKKGLRKFLANPIFSSQVPISKHSSQKMVTFVVLFCPSQGHFHI